MEIEPMEKTSFITTAAEMPNMINPMNTSFKM